MVTVRNASGRIQVKAWGKNEVQVAWTNAGGKALVETNRPGIALKSSPIWPMKWRPRRTLRRILKSLSRSRVN